MSLGNSTNIIIALLGLAAVMFAITSFTGGGKWRKRYDDEREEYASYAERADSELSAARQRIAKLESDYRTLLQQHSDTLVSIADLKAETAGGIGAGAEPVIAPVAASHTAIETPSATVPEASVEAPAAPVSLASTPATEADIETPAETMPEAVAPAPENWPIASETVPGAAYSHLIAPFGAAVASPPPPIFVVTPLRAVEPEREAEVMPAAEAALPTPIGTAPEETGFAMAHDSDPEAIASVKPAAEPLASAAEAAPFDPSPHLSEAAHEAEGEPVPEPHHELGETAVAAATPAEEPAPVSDAPAKAWFGSAKRDDLMRLRGIDTVLNARLFGLGVTSYEDIVQLSQEDEMALEQRLDIPAGYITREQWREQASLLRSGDETTFNHRFGSIDA